MGLSYYWKLISLEYEVKEKKGTWLIGISPLKVDKGFDDSAGWRDITTNFKKECFYYFVKQAACSMIPTDSLSFEFIYCYSISSQNWLNRFSKLARFWQEYAVKYKLVLLDVTYQYRKFYCVVNYKRFEEYLAHSHC